MCIRSVTKRMSVRLCKNIEENIGHSGRFDMKEEKVKVRECSTKNNEQKCCLVVWPLQTLWASVDLHQWSYKYVRNVARFAYMLERKNKHSKNFVVHGRLCVQSRKWMTGAKLKNQALLQALLLRVFPAEHNRELKQPRWWRLQVNLCYLKLYRTPTHSIRKMLAKFFWNWILKDCIKIQEEKKKVIVLCSRPRHNVKLGTFML